MNRNYFIYEGDEIIEQGSTDVSWREVREKRDEQLQQTDWRFMSDQTPSDEWILYRQELRDLPQNYADANAAADSFPIMPED